MPTPFKVNVTIEHGQLHESLDLEEDRQLMITRLDEILSDISDTNKELRDGVIQILIDQLRTDNGHEPLIVRTDEQIVWRSNIVNDKGEKNPIEVDVDLYPDRPAVPTPQGPKKRTPHKVAKGSPFDLPSKTGLEVPSGKYKNAGDSRNQKFYKFSIKAKDILENPLLLDPCIICDR